MSVNSSENEVDQFLRNTEEAKFYQLRMEYIDAQLCIKKSYAILLLIVCINVIVNRIFEFEDNRDIDIILHLALLTYIFLIEVCFKKQY
jgi:hypothetical protein